MGALLSLGLCFSFQRGFTCGLGRRKKDSQSDTPEPGMPGKGVASQLLALTQKVGVGREDARKAGRGLRGPHCTAREGAPEMEAMAAGRGGEPIQDLLPSRYLVPGLRGTMRVAGAWSCFLGALHSQDLGGTGLVPSWRKVYQLGGRCHPWVPARCLGPGLDSLIRK